MTRGVATGTPAAGPLAGRRILVTRAADQAGEMVAALQALGAEPCLCPTIAILDPPDFTEFDAALDALDRFEFLILTSSNAVDACMRRLTARRVEPAALAALCVVAVGPKTAEALQAYGRQADLVPDDYRAEGVVALLAGRVAGKRILYPHAELARDLIISELGRHGALLTAPVAYRSGPPPEAADQLRQALADGLDLLTFTASSTARNLVDLLDEPWRSQAQQIPVAAIGPLTSRTCRELGLRVVIEPPAATVDALLAAIVDYYATTSP
ncbi:MAG: uroporphyrinogen-III synthase [Desulfuromonadales bacterium]|nr:uroporphyrinogen-III synthase [Desulfuromonadales bacterium]